MRDGPQSSQAAGRALLLVNPNARRGGEATGPVRRRLEAAGLTVEVDHFSGPDEIEADIDRRAGEVDRVIIAGGDGTLSGSAAAVRKSGLPLGILPLGTANDLARTLGIPDDLQAAADVIAAGHRRVIDLGAVNGRPFFNVASIGLGVDLARSLDSGLKRRWGRLSYAVAAFRVLSRAKRFSARIIEEAGETRVRTLQIAVGNGRFYGGGTVIEETATIDDGYLDLYSLEMANVWKLALMMRTFRTGAHGAWSEVRTARGSAFEVRTRKPQPVNVDGEIVAETPARFEVLPRAITVFAPAPPR